MDGVGEFPPIVATPVRLDAIPNGVGVAFFGFCLVLLLFVMVAVHSSLEYCEKRFVRGKT